MDVFETNGAISWHELITDDVETAKRFYSESFGWVLSEMPMPDTDKPYIVIKVGEESIGGIMEKSPEAANTPSGWTNYVTVADVDATVERVKSLGGQVIVPPWDVEGVGRMARLQDKEGATIAIITYNMPND